MERRKAETEMSTTTESETRWSEIESWLKWQTKVYGDVGTLGPLAQGQALVYIADLLALLGSKWAAHQRKLRELDAVLAEARVNNPVGVRLTELALERMDNEESSSPSGFEQLVRLRKAAEKALKWMDDYGIEVGRAEVAIALRNALVRTKGNRSSA